MRYLVVEAHPDDLVFFCGGTVAKLVHAGHEVQVLTITDGQQGTLDKSFVSEYQLANVMRAEHIRALEIIGIKSIRFLGEKNHFLEPTHSLRERVTRIIRELRPEVVVTFDPWNNDENPDHRAVGQVTLEACSYAHMHLFHQEHLLEGLMPAFVSKIIFFKTPTPLTLVDITEFLEVKLQAALCYESQVKMMKEEGLLRLRQLNMKNDYFEHGDEYFLRSLFTKQAQEIGKLAGIPLAEGLKVRGLGILGNASEIAGNLSV